MAENTDKIDQDKPKGPVESSHDSERLIAEANDFFGVPPHVVAGALALSKPANKAHFTRTEVEKLLREWDNLEQDQGEE